MKVDVDSVQWIFEREYSERSGLPVQGFVDEHVLAIVNRLSANEGFVECVQN
jgi:hypothetical protein